MSPSSVGAPESLTSAVYADADAIDASKDSDACVPEVYVGTLPKEVDWNCPPIIIWPPREFTVKDLPYPPPF